MADKTNKKLHWCLQVFCIINVCFSIAAICLAVLLYHKKAALYKDEVPLICVPCESLVLSDDYKDDHRDRFEQIVEDGVQTCCANTPEQTSLLVDVIVENRIRIERTSGGLRPMARTVQQANPTQERVGNLMAAFSYLRGPLQSAPYREAPGKEYIREWSFSHDLTYRKIGIDFDAGRGRFIITESGLYLVTCQLGFSSPTDRTTRIIKGKDNTASKQFEFFVARHNQRSRGDPEVLMSHREEETCQLNSGDPCHTGLSAANLRLRQGDEIFVYTNAKDLVIAKNQFSYFGIVQIS